MTQAPDTARHRIAEPASPPTTATRFALPSWAAAAGIAVLPALLMLVVGGFRLKRPSLGWDENATWLVSQRTPGQIIEQARHFDGVIAPYYMFMHFWTSVFGTSEFWLRAPSLIAVALGAGIAADLGRRLFGPGVGLLTGLLLVLVPQLSRYAQDARAYGLAFLFATLATWLLYRALERPVWGRWIWYAVAVMLVGWAHMLGSLVLIGHAYAVLSRWRSGRDRAMLRWLVVTPIALVPVLPFLYLGLTQRGNQLDWLPPMSVEQIWAAPGDIFGSAAAGLLLIGLALLAHNADPRPVREMAVLAALPPIVLIAVSFAGSSLWVPRYVLFIVPPLAMLAAAGLGGLRVTAGRLTRLVGANPRPVVALVLLAAVAVPAQLSVRGYASHMGPNFRTVARIIARDQQPGDVIVYGASGTWSLRAGIDYQLRGKTKPRDVLLQRPAAQVGQLNAVQCADEVACLGASPRVWFFREWQSGAPLSNAGALMATFRNNYRQAGVWHATKATLVLFVRR